MLEARGLEAGYGDGQVLFGIDLDVPGGRIHGLMGRNGTGKTTLMRTLMGLVAPSAGSVRFAGKDIAGLATHEIARRGIAYVPQGREIFTEFTVEENLELGILGMNGGALPEGLFERFPILRERRGQRAGTLSGGEQQQLAIARALVAGPRLLLLDEPSEGIQPSIVAEIAATLKSISADEGLTILIVEQNIDVVLSIAERCAFIDGGRITAEHEVADLRRDRAVLERHLGL